MAEEENAAADPERKLQGDLRRIGVSLEAELLQEFDRDFYLRRLGGNRLIWPLGMGSLKFADFFEKNFQFRQGKLMEH